MKKCTKIIFSILLTISLILVTMSFIGENIVVKTFSQEILSKKISGYFLDEIVYDVDIEELGKIEDNIRASKYTDRIASKFIRAIVENVGNSDDIKFDISKEVDSLILENMPEKFYSEKADTTKEYLNKNIVRIEKDLEESLIYSFGNSYIIILKLYSILTNIWFRIFMIIICIIAIIALVVEEKNKAVKAIAISNIITMIVTIITFIIIKLLLNFIDQRLTGGWLSNIYLRGMFILIMFEFIINLILVISTIKLKRNN